MSAATTTLNVLQWAKDPDGIPPQGDLFELKELLDNDSVFNKVLMQCAAVSAARLGLTHLSINKDEPIHSDALLLAAAIGSVVYEPEISIELIRCTNAPNSLMQLVIHNSLVFPALVSSILPTAHREELLLRSPLTSVLYLPPKGGEDQTIAMCMKFASFDEGRRLLVRRFADPEANTDQIAWRGRIMSAMRVDERYRSLILDIYEAAIALYGNKWRQLIQKAIHILTSKEPTNNELKEALSIGSWWEPLRAIYVSTHETIRERNYLEFHTYLAGIRLAAQVGRLREGLK